MGVRQGLAGPIQVPKSADCWLLHSITRICAICRSSPAVAGGPMHKPSRLKERSTPVGNMKGAFVPGGSPRFLADSEARPAHILQALPRLLDNRTFILSRGSVMEHDGFRTATAGQSRPSRQGGGLGHPPTMATSAMEMPIG